MADVDAVKVTLYTFIDEFLFSESDDEEYECNAQQKFVLITAVANEW